VGGIAAATQGSGAGNPAVAVGPGWLSGPRFDRHFIFTSAAIAILSGVLMAARPGLFVPVLMPDLWLLGYHHVVSTYTRLCFDRDSFARRRWLIVGLLPAVFGGIDENERLGRAIFCLVPLWGILRRAHQAPETFLGQELWHPPVPAIVVDLVTVLALAGLAWWGIGRLRLWRARRLQLVLAAVVLRALMRGQPERRGAVRMLGAPVLQPVAILSYSLYLVHMTVIPAAFTTSKGLNMAIIGVSIPNICFFGVFYIGFSILAALILHFTVEKPFLAWQ